VYCFSMFSNKLDLEQETSFYYSHFLFIFINRSFCQKVIFRLVILSMDHFVNGPFCLWVILSIGDFLISHFVIVVTLLTNHFVKVSFSIHHFVNCLIHYSMLPKISFGHSLLIKMT
jgi:hypothetical protein